MSESYRINIGKARASSRKKRAGKAVRVLKKRISRISGFSDVRISNGLNEKIWSKGGKPPKHLDVQLIEEEDHVIADVAGAEHEKKVAEAEPEKAEKDEEPEEEEEENAYDIPEEVQEVLKTGSISDGKDAVKEMNKADFEKLLNFEKAHKNRKGMKKFLRSNSR